MGDNTERKIIKSTQLTFRVIKALQTIERGRVSEVASELGVPDSTAYHHLATLRDMGYVINRDGRYQLGMKFLEISEAAKQTRKWYPLIELKVDELAEITGERVQFNVEEQGELIYVYVSRGNNAIEVGPSIGESVPIHATSVGKSILASLPQDQTDEMIDCIDFEQNTDQTKTSREKLERELEAIRERGYAYNDEEYYEGIKAVGAPITTPDGRTIGALSVSGPTQRMKGDRYEEELPELLLGAANEIEVNITYS